MHVRKTVAICVERPFAAGGGVALDDECSGLAARHYAQILEAVDRQSAKAPQIVGWSMSLCRKSRARSAETRISAPPPSISAAAIGTDRRSAASSVRPRR